MDNKLLSSRLREMAVNKGTINCLGCGYENSCGIHGCAIMKKAAEIVERTTWVSVKDTLPESGIVLATDGRFVYTAPVSTVKDDKYITHWMQLPDLPGKERRDV